MLLLDTSVASLLHPKKSDSPLVALCSADLVGHELAISFQTAAEMLRWAIQNNWGAVRRAQLESLIASFALLLPAAPMMKAWAEVMTAAEEAGRRLEPDDAWIAAAAIRHNLTLVTHDSDLLDLPIPNLTVHT